MMKPYENYKETKNSVLNGIPTHWRWLRNSSVFHEVVDTNNENMQLLSITVQKGVIPQSSTGRKERMSEDNTSYKRILKDDIGYNLMNAFIGAIGVSKYDGIISPAYAVCRFRNKENYNPDFFHYLFRTSEYMQEFDNNSYGIMIERNRLYFDRFKTIYVPAPTRSEQDQIVRYLDWQLSKINKLIKAKKKQVELLNEQKQAIINKAVTKGLDDTVPMKESGVEGLGKIPFNWDLKALKHFVTSNDEALTNSTDPDLIINYIDISTVGFGYLKQNIAKYEFSQAPSRARRKVKIGDTIISTVRTYLKSMCFIDKTLDGCIASTGFSVLRPKGNVFPEVLSFALCSDYFVNSVSKNSIGVSYPAISDTKLCSLKIALPNTLEEQRKIYDYVKGSTKLFDESIKAIRGELDLLTEYKTSLISSVVTGKVDVRDIEIPEFEIDGDQQDVDEIEDTEDVEELEVE